MNATILKDEKPFPVTDQCEYWGEPFEEIYCYYVASNHSLHYVDAETYFRIGCATICKSREHAVEVFEKFVKDQKNSEISVKV